MVVTPRLATLVASMVALSTMASATGILLPLYVYPSAVWDDGAANWKPALDAIKAKTSTSWLVVVNPDSGPGATGQPGNGDVNYVSGIQQLNAQANVKTIGYVRTNYGASPAVELNANITNYAGWTGTSQVKGIFFDETSASSLDYLKAAVAHARSAFGSRAITTICNFGAATPAAFYGQSVCDVSIVFESYLNNPSAPYYDGQATLNANIPVGAGHAANSAVVVHHFAGTNHNGVVASTSLLWSYIQEAKNYGLGWLYFCSGDYDSITTSPATIGALAASF